MYATRAYSDSSSWVAQFYVKRFFRIAPLFYVMCLATVFILDAKAAAPSMEETALNVIFLNNLFPQYSDSLVRAGWSISVEVMFYAVFPLLFLFVRSIAVSVAVLALAIVFALVTRPALDLVPAVFGPYGYYSWQANLPFFLFGVLAFLAYDRLRRTGIGVQSPGKITSILVHLGFFLSAAATLAPIVLFDEWLRAHAHADTFFWGAFFAVLCVWLSVRPIRLFGWGPFQFLGERSYSLYLVHPFLLTLAAPVVRAIEPALRPALGGPAALITTAVLAYLGVIVLASATYAAIERPGMALGNWIVRALRRRSKPGPAGDENPAAALP